MSIRALKRRLMRRLGLMPPKYKSFVVGSSENYETMGRSQFEMLRFWGMRQMDYLLDIGCGSLSGGRFAVRFLEPGRYFGIEPEQWLIDQAIEEELGAQLLAEKRPSFSNDSGFDLSIFGRRFDYLVAHSILSHTSLDQMRKIITEAAKVLEPSGIFLASYVPGDRDYSGSQWVYPGVARYTMATIELLAREAGLRCDNSRWPHPGSQRWLVFYRESNQSFVDQRLRAAPDGPDNSAAATQPPSAG